MWLNGRTSVRGSNRALFVVLIGFWLKGGRVVMSACCSVPLGRSVVTRFGVAGDNFGEEGGRAIGSMLELNSSITNLYLNGKLLFFRVLCGGAGDCIFALLQVTNVLAGNKIGPEGAPAIWSALERNSTLTYLIVV